MEFVVWVSTRLTEIPKEVGAFPTLKDAERFGERWDASKNKRRELNYDVFITTDTGDMFVWFPPSKEWLEVYHTEAKEAV